MNDRCKSTIDLDWEDDIGDMGDHATSFRCELKEGHEGKHRASFVWTRTVSLAQTANGKEESTDRP